MRELESQRRGPEDAESVVVFLHGYGADGSDLMGLAEPLAPLLPGTAFYAPDAPEASAVNPAGRQWFPIPWLDGSTEAAAGASMARSVSELNTFLDKVLAVEGIDAERLVLVGFSQGAMMALHVAPRRPEAIAGLIGISGRLLYPETLGSESIVRFPVLLIHGDSDEMVPPESMSEAAQALEAADFEVGTVIMDGTGHGISPQGLEAAARFLVALIEE